MKSQFIIKLFAIIIVVILVLFLVFFIAGYINKYSDFEKGIVIDELDDKDKVILCSYFNFENNKDISFDCLEYKQGLKDIYIKLYVKTDHSQTNGMLENYVNSNANYYLDSMDFSIDDNHAGYNQLVNENNPNKYVFVFHYGNDDIIVFYSKASDVFVADLIDEKMSKKEYKKH